MADIRKIWLVAHPTSQFKEDVKDLARRNNLKIVDAKHAAIYAKHPSMIASKPPALTSRTAEQKAAEAKAAEAANAAEKAAAEKAEIKELERKIGLEIEVRTRLESKAAATTKKK